MSNCEKCWEDAHSMQTGDVAKAYQKLVRERNENPCTPEEQAGGRTEADECCICKRNTIHIYTGKCTNPHCEQKING